MTCNCDRPYFDANGLPSSATDCKRCALKEKANETPDEAVEPGCSCDQRGRNISCERCKP